MMVAIISIARPKESPAHRVRCQKLWDRLLTHWPGPWSELACEAVADFDRHQLDLRFPASVRLTFTELSSLIRLIFPAEDLDVGLDGPCLHIKLAGVTWPWGT